MYRLNQTTKRRKSARGTTISLMLEVLSLSLMIVCAYATSAIAESGGSLARETRGGGSSLEEAKRAAAEADAAAAEARELYEGLEAERTRALDPRDDAGESDVSDREGAERERGALEEQRAPHTEKGIDSAVADAERAAREAREAARDARSVLIEVRAERAARRNRYARTGFLLGVSASYLVEDFDTGDLRVDDSRGIAAVVGYRADPHFSVEVRGEYLDGFDIRVPGVDPESVNAELDGLLFTAGPKFYLLTGTAQPFVGFGLGVMRARLRGLAPSGARFNVSETDFAARVAGGFDFFVTENLALNFEAAYVVPGGDVNGLDFASFSGGVVLRF